jgi:hypothetical protein
MTEFAQVFANTKESIKGGASSSFFFDDTSPNDSNAGDKDMIVGTEKILPARRFKIREGRNRQPNAVHDDVAFLGHVAATP